MMVEDELNMAGLNIDFLRQRRLYRQFIPNLLTSSDIILPLTLVAMHFKGIS